MKEKDVIDLSNEIVEGRFYQIYVLKFFYLKLQQDEEIKKTVKKVINNLAPKSLTEQTFHILQLLVSSNSKNRFQQWIFLLKSSRESSF